MGTTVIKGQDYPAFRQACGWVVRRLAGESVDDIAADEDIDAWIIEEAMRPIMEDLRAGRHIPEIPIDVVRHALREDPLT